MLLLTAGHQYSLAAIALRRDQRAFSARFAYNRPSASVNPEALVVPACSAAALI